MKIDYNNFAKYYYYKLMNKLRNFQNYNGPINYVAYIPKVIKLDAYHNVPRTNSFLPNWDIDVNENIELFEDYLNFLAETHPLLSPCVYNDNMLKISYKAYIDQPNVEFNDFLEEIINIGIEICQELGVLS